MICRVATFDTRPDISEEKMVAFRAWMKSQPGFKTMYHLHDPSTGKAMSISFWESAEQMMAMKDRTPPGGAIGLKSSKVEIFPDVVES
jgi:heme-degrading monooxygenase HmoA